MASSDYYNGESRRLWQMGYASKKAISGGRMVRRRHAVKRWNFRFTIFRHELVSQSPPDSHLLLIRIEQLHIRYMFYNPYLFNHITMVGCEGNQI